MAAIHPDRGWGAMNDDGREWRDLLLRLLDGIKDDIGVLRDNHGETDKVARSALDKLSEVERRMANVERESNHTAISVVEIKALARGAGLVSGAITGVLGAVLTAFALRALNLT